MQKPWLILVAAMVSVAGPSKSEGRSAVSNHFYCAAMIGAADRLMFDGKVPRDEAFLRGALFSAMAHVNAWALPRNLPEKEAFAAINAERDHMIATLSSADIVRRAKACLDV